MGNKDLRTLLESSKEKIKEKEAKEAYLNLVQQYNKVVSFDNYANVCEQLKKVFPDNEICKEHLPADCEEESMKILKAGVDTCFAALGGKSSNNSVCQHDDIPLLKAVCDQDGRKVQDLLYKGEHVNRINQNGENALHLAVKKNDYNIASTLMFNNINVNQKDNNSYTPLMLAVAGGNQNITNYILDKGANCLAENNYKQNVFHIAMENNNSDILQTLVISYRCQSGLNATDMRGNTPLHLAAEHNNINAVELLLQYGDPWEAKNDDGKTQKDLTTNPKIKELLEERL